ncbi:hypothetical protein [Chryseobacterium defluvii]|uniref:Uncharacterized protein n=1 Tax=Chryseobacterium defluvii TaxID=160396 RepID=A0A495SF76_9FLAO|nr:hypothetical protein [Chryseobacterium defluvii]RKS98269.1 hypothetical protein BCF58_2410 [Chryseobacterium defluvii]
MTVRNSILVYRYVKMVSLILLIIKGIDFTSPLTFNTIIKIVFILGASYILSELFGFLLIKLLISFSKYPVILSKCFEKISYFHKDSNLQKIPFVIETFLKDNELNTTIDIHTFKDVYYLEFSESGLSYKGKSLQWKNVVSWKYKRMSKGRNNIDDIVFTYKNENNQIQNMNLNSYEMQIFSYELLIMTVAFYFK